MPEPRTHVVDEWVVTVRAAADLPVERVAVARRAMDLALTRAALAVGLAVPEVEVLVE